MSIKKIGPYLTEAIQNDGATTIRPNGQDKTGVSSGFSPDRVEFSRNYLDLTLATKAVMASGDIRTEKVGHVKNRLASGNYQIDPTGIAYKMLDEVK